MDVENYTPETLFRDNAEYNSKLAKAKTRLRKYHPLKLNCDPQLPIAGITAQEVLKKLNFLGIILTERSLRNYAYRGWIMPPCTVNLGRGVGKKTYYDETVVSEIQKIKLKAVIN